MSRQRKRITTGNEGEHYAQTLIEMQQLCEDLDLSFRAEIMALAQQWIDQHTQPPEPDHDRQEQEN